MATNTTVAERESHKPKASAGTVARGRSGGCSGTSWPSSASSSSRSCCSSGSSGRSSRRGRTRPRTCRRSSPTASCRCPPLSPNHMLGTDQLGRDLLSRLLDGARISVTVAFVVQIVIIFIGVPVGALAGWFGGRADNVLMRFTDVIYAFPDLLFIILLSVAFRETLFGQALDGLFLVFVAIGLTSLGDRRPPRPAARCCRSRRRNSSRRPRRSACPTGRS